MKMQCFDMTPNLRDHVSICKLFTRLVVLFRDDMQKAIS